VLKLLQQWRESNALPSANPAWRVQRGEGGLNPDGNQGGGLNPGGGAAGGLVPPGDPKTWVVLGIESSCDDTAAAVIRGDGTVLAHRIASQVCASACRGMLLALPNSPEQRALGCLMLSTAVQTGGFLCEHVSNPNLIYPAQLPSKSGTEVM
jgi:hypothetical protein